MTLQDYYRTALAYHEVEKNNQTDVLPLLQHEDDGAGYHNYLVLAKDQHHPLDVSCKNSLVIEIKKFEGLSDGNQMEKPWNQELLALFYGHHH